MLGRTKMILFTINDVYHKRSFTVRNLPQSHSIMEMERQRAGGGGGGDEGGTYRQTDSATTE